MTEQIGTYTCLQCGSAFEREAHRGFKFCSRACYHSSRVGRPRSIRQLPIERCCEWCGGRFRSLSSAGARQRYCSRSCQAYDKADQRQCNVLSATAAAYLAAIVDGEGCITISDRRASRPGSTRPSIRLYVCNTHGPLLEWIAAETGLGSIVDRGVKTSGVVKAKKKIYSWSVSSLGAVSVLRQISRYMIEKKDLAEAAILSQVGSEARKASPSVSP